MERGRVLRDSGWQAWYRAQHDRRCLQTGSSFEDYVTAVLSRFHDDFINPTPAGTLGDGGCDGLEGRRRVKEQLKKMGSFEYYQTSFSYTDQVTGEERFVGVPEQGGRDLISTDPLAPGTVYTSGVTADGTVGPYRVEVSVANGTGKLKLAGGVSGAMKESIQRTFSYLQSRKGELGIARDFDTSDLHVEVIDLLANRVEAEIGVAFFIAAYSALRRAPVAPALLVLGDMSVQGNIKPLRSLTEPLQVAKDNGAKRALIPIENKRNFMDVPADVVEFVDPIFYGDPKTAAMKVLGLS